jgi:hypothetical protein
MVKEETSDGYTTELNNGTSGICNDLLGEPPPVPRFVMAYTSFIRRLPEKKG